MNRSFFIIIVPALLIAAGDLIAMVLFFGGIYWLSKRSGKKAKTGG